VYDNGIYTTILIFVPLCLSWYYTEDYGSRRDIDERKLDKITELTIFL
jgi:hypothetical protein